MLLGLSGVDELLVVCQLLFLSLLWFFLLLSEVFFML